MDAVLALGGSWGTLSEVALAARTGVPVFSVAGWDLTGLTDEPDAPRVVACDSVDAAVERIAQVLG